MAETVFAVIMFAAAAGLSVTAVRQLRCKGRCLNNAYIWASEEERKNTDYKPYYKQSGTVFLIIAAMAVLEGLYILLKSRWFMIGGILLLTAMTVYAVGSSVRIEKTEKTINNVQNKKGEITVGNKRFVKIYSQGTLTATEIWVDLKTGVNYIYHFSGYSGGMTPLLDKDGKPVITPPEEMYE